jgi:lysophospholipase L1-like esterase
MTTVLATVSTGSGTTTEEVTVTGLSADSGTIVPTSPAGTIGDNALVLFNWDPSTQLTNWLAAEAQVAAGVPGATAKIVAMGDSTTRGYESATSDFTALSYPVELARALTADGVAAQYDNFLGGSPDNGEISDARISFIDGATWGGNEDAGGTPIYLDGTGQGFTFTLDAPGDYDRVQLSYIDVGSGSVNVSIDGGPVLSTIHFGNTGNTLTTTIDIPAGMHSALTVTSTSSNPVFIQGAAFYSSTIPAVQVYNAGIPGIDSGQSDTSLVNGMAVKGSAEGYGPTAGVAALQPNLVLIDLGLNDILGDLDTTAQTVANISQMVTTLRSVGSDVIIVIPNPSSSASVIAALPALRSALETYALSANVPIIDLSATYDDSWADLNAAGLMSDYVHPDATLYADIGYRIGALLANAETYSCFAAGTLILTERGEMPVEDLAIGMKVRTHSGAASPIIWIGRRTLDLRYYPSPEHAWPVLICAGALGSGLPVRDLILSPDHALYLEGHLIPAKVLVNGVSIRQVARNQITYYHVELAEHDVLLAQGAPAESYLDTGNRCAFENAGKVTVLHPDFAKSLREERGCAPLAEAGPVVEAVRQRILNRIKIDITEDPDLRITYRDGGAIVTSRSAVPGEISADPRDRRRLGVKIAALRISDRIIPIDHPDLSEGWHDVEADGRWTDGHAVVPRSVLAGAARLEVRLAATTRYPLNVALQRKRRAIR